jgi:predicted NBD/HSP70 family sugar kinase
LIITPTVLPPSPLDAEPPPPLSSPPQAASGERRRNTAGAGRLLELVRTGVADTRVALTRESGLARATVNDRLDLLLDAGLIADNGNAASTGGRRAVSFAFNESSGVVFVADLGASAAGLAVCDLAANVLVHERHAIDIAAGPDVNLALVRDRMPELLAAAGRTEADVVAVTIGVPGPVQASPPRVVSPPIMTGWDDVVVPDALALPLPVPVLVGKDTNLMALGEHRARFADDDHILAVKVGTGVGSGIICARSLHRGAEGAAGDIGHIPVPGVEEPCVCGKVGCVEAKAGGWALARDLRALGHEVHNSRDVVAMIRAREPDAMRLVNESAKLLGIAIADAVNVLNPSTVVLGGDIATAHEHLLAHVREVVYTRSLPLATRSLDIVVSDLGNRAGILGGAYLAIEHRLRPDALDQELERRIGSGAPLNAWA